MEGNTTTQEPILQKWLSHHLPADHAAAEPIIIIAIESFMMNNVY